MVIICVMKIMVLVVEIYFLVQGPAGVEYIRTICDSTRYNQLDWNSFGPNIEEYVQMTVNNWCNN